MLLLKAGFAPPEAKSSSNVLMKVLTRLWSDNADRRVWTDPNNTARAPQQLLYIEYTRISGTHREHCPKKTQKKHLHESVFSPGLVHSPWDTALNPRSRIRKTKLTHSIEQRRGGGDRLQHVKPRTQLGIFQRLCAVPHWLELVWAIQKLTFPVGTKKKVEESRKLNFNKRATEIPHKDSVAVLTGGYFSGESRSTLSVRWWKYLGVNSLNQDFSEVWFSGDCSLSIYRRLICIG